MLIIISDIDLVLKMRSDTFSADPCVPFPKGISQYYAGRLWETGF